MNIAVLLLPGMRTFEVSTVCEVFNGGTAPGEPARHQMVFVAAQTGPVHLEYGFSVDAEALEAAHDADVLIVPGVVDIDGLIHDLATGHHAAEIATIRAAHARGAHVVSLCTGLFLVAATSLLNGREATTHWYWTDRLRETYPHIRIRDNVLYTHDESARLWTSAGVTAALDLCLALLGELEGAGAATESARGMVVAATRSGGQAQFVPPRYRLHELAGSEYAELQELVRGTLERPWTVQLMAEATRQTPRTLQRRFGRATGITPKEWLIGERIATVQELLATTDLTIEQIAHRSGFRSTDLLRKHFTRIVEVSPSRYRDTFRRPPAEGRRTITGRRSAAR